MEEKTDEEIVLIYKQGNKTAFPYLIEKYSSPLFNFIARIVGKEEASDVVQNTLIKVWKNIGKYNEEKASFKTWLFTIARNNTTDFLRKKKPILFSDLIKKETEGENEEADLLISEIFTQDMLEKMENVDLLNRAMEKIPTKYREIIILHYQEDLTLREIAKILSIPENTVKSYHRRAILQMKKVI